MTSLPVYPNPSGPRPGDPRSGGEAWWRYLLTVGLAIALTFALAAAIILPLSVSHLWPGDMANRLADPGRPLGFYGLNGAVFLVLLAAFAMAIRLVHHQSFGEVAGRWSWSQFGWAALAWTLASITMAAIDYLVAPKGFHASADARTPMLAVVACGALAIQTFTEEFVFRGYVAQGLYRMTRRAAPAALIAGLIFGAAHIPNGAPQAITATAFGVVLSLIAIRTGGIAAPYGLHLANNLFASLVLVSGGDVFRGSPALYTQDTPQLTWWDAGLYVLALIVTALALRTRLQPAAAPSPTA